MAQHFRGACPFLASLLPSLQIDGYFDMGDGRKMKMQKQFPFTVGHEIEGVVVAVGPDAKGKVNIGQDYGIYPWGGCRDCGDCRVGAQNLCGKPHENDLGNGKNIYGGRRPDAAAAMPHPRLLRITPEQQPGLMLLLLRLLLVLLLYSSTPWPHPHPSPRCALRLRLARARAARGILLRQDGDR